MYTVAGRLVDRFGVRIGATVCVAWWSISSMLTGFARGPMSLALFRGLLGIGEPGIFPAGVKACGEWFPPKMRALATGIFSSGSAVGAVLAAPIVVALTHHFGWRLAFVLPGFLGLLWIPLWLRIYHHPSKHPAVKPSELEALDAGEVEENKPTWREILQKRHVWGLVLARIASDPVWYFYLFWLPDYLQRVRNLSLTEIGLYGWIPFLFADLGCVCGGAISDKLVRRGWSAIRARFATLLGVALLAPFGVFIGSVESTVGAIVITCMITFLCQAWSTVIATLSTEVSAPSERATVLGLMGTAGSLGGLLFAQLLGFTIGKFGYSSAFAMAAVMHPVGFIILFVQFRHLLSRKVS